MFSFGSVEERSMACNNGMTFEQEIISPHRLLIMRIRSKQHASIKFTSERLRLYNADN